MKAHFPLKNWFKISVGKQEVFLLFAEVLDNTMTIESVSAKELYANLLQLSFSPFFKVTFARIPKISHNVCGQADRGKSFHGKCPSSFLELILSANCSCCETHRTIEGHQEEQVPNLQEEAEPRFLQYLLR